MSIINESFFHVKYGAVCPEAYARAGADSYVMFSIGQLDHFTIAALVPFCDIFP